MKRLNTIKADLFEIGEDIRFNSTFSLDPASLLRKMERSSRKLNKNMVYLKEIISKKNGSNT